MTGISRYCASCSDPACLLAKVSRRKFSSEESDTRTVRPGAGMDAAGARTPSHVASSPAPAFCPGSPAVAATPGGTTLHFNDYVIFVQMFNHRYIHMPVLTIVLPGEAG